MRRTQERSADAPAPTGPAPPSGAAARIPTAWPVNCAPGQVVALEQLAGNRAVTRYLGLQRDADATAGVVRPVIGEVPARSLLVDDDQSAGPDQQSKSEFLDGLRSALTAVVEPALAATGRTTQDCPALAKWFAYFQAQSGANVDRAVRLYAPVTAGAAKAADYVPAIVTRVMEAVARFAVTGEVTGVPDGEDLTCDVEPEAAGPGQDLPGGEPPPGGSLSVQQAPEGQVQAGLAEVSAVESDGGGVADVRRAAAGALPEPGQALDASTRLRMAPLLGDSLDGVRVHTGPAGQALAAREGALAVTTGTDIAFAAGEYRPGTISGDALLAHELAHVAQQRSAAVEAARLRPGEPADGPLEADADRSATGVVVALWAGLKGRAAEVAANAMPQLRSGLRLQGCKNKKPTAADLAIEGKPAGAKSDTTTIYFQKNSAVLDKDEKDKAELLAKGNLAADLELRGHTSEEELNPAALATARIGAVDNAMLNVKHTGTRFPLPEPLVGTNQLDYRGQRNVNVDVRAPGLPPPVANNVPVPAVVPCGLARDNKLAAAVHDATDRLNIAIAACSAAAPSAATTAALVRWRFGAPAAAQVAANLTKIRDHVATLTRADAHKCGTLSDGSCGSSDAYNKGHGAKPTGAAVMTLCPSFDGQGAVDSAQLLIHEAAHGTTGVFTQDLSYKHERVIDFLSPAEALKNSDSYCQLVEQLNSGVEPPSGPNPPDTVKDDKGVAVPPGSPQDFQSRQALAWAEKWMTASYQVMAQTYDEIEVGAGWGAFGKYVMQAEVSDRFKLTKPPDMPTMADKAAAAAIHDRFHTMRWVFKEQAVAVTIKPKGTAPALLGWAPGPGPTLVVSEDFFSLDKTAQLQLVLHQLVEATPGISKDMRDNYVEMADAFRQLKSIGAP